MDSFVDCISCCEPTTLPQLLQQSNDQRMQTLTKLTTIVLKSFSSKSVWGMKRCYQCRHLKLVGLNEGDFYSCICNLPSITDAWALQYGPTCALESFSVDSCVICRESYEALYHCFSSPCFSSLREFSLRPIDKDKGSQMNEREWTPICGYLRTGACPHLESISISNNNVGYQGIEALVEAYLSGKMSKCSHLDISGNSIGNRGAIALSRLFDNPFACTSLEYLDLSDNKIHSKGFDVFLAHFGSITHEKLQYVNWSYNPLKADSIRTFLRIVEMGHCPQLHCLNMSGISLKNDVSTTFATMIRSDAFKYLEELYLADCSLSLECIEHICRAIVDMPLQQLHTLSLAHNRLNAACVHVLCSVLQKEQLPSLKELDLGHNKLGDEGVKEFCDNNKDEVMTQVEVLNLCDNGIGNEGAFIIFDNVRHRVWSKLRDLNLERNKFTTVTAVQLRSLLEMDNDLDTIRLTDMTKRRATVPNYRRQANKPPEMQGVDMQSVPTTVLTESVLTPTAYRVCNK